MKIIRLLSVLLIAGVVFSSCTTSNLTRGESYSAFYDEKPITLLVMPPINNSTDVEAKELLYTSISRPLAEAGYYVISPHLAMDVFKMESAYDAELFLDQNVGAFGKVFGADAVIFTIINKWQKIGIGIQTEISYIVKSTRTNEVLFEKNCDLFLDLTVDSGNSSLIGQLVSLSATLINTAATDKIVAARRCNYYVLQDLPRGKYSPQHMLDKEEKALPKEIKASVKN